MEKPMSHLYDVIGQYEKQCLTCGRCVKNCPMVPYTDLKGVDPAKIMEEVRDLFRHRKIGQLARTRVYSCLFCNACRVVCPTKLYPGLVFGAGKGVLRELGDPLPKGVDSILKAAAEMMEQAVPSFQGYSGQPDWLITDMSSRPVETARTVLFSSCFGLVEKNVPGYNRQDSPANRSRYQGPGRVRFLLRRAPLHCRQAAGGASAVFQADPGAGGFFA